MTLYKVALSAKARSVSKHSFLVNAKLAKDKLVREGKLGYKIYTWNKYISKWIKMY